MPDRRRRAYCRRVLTALPHRVRSIALAGLVAGLSTACIGSDDPPQGSSAAPTTATGSVASTGSTASVTGPSGATGVTRASGSTSATGAGGSTAGSQDPPDVEPDPGNAACDLLTEEVVEPIFGVDFGVASDVMVGEHSTCVLRNGANSISVDLRITTGRRADDEYEALFASVAGSDGVRELDDLGDRAFRAFAANDAHVLALVGDTMVRLSTSTLDGSLPDETLALAREIVARV